MSEHDPKLVEAVARGLAGYDAQDELFHGDECEEWWTTPNHLADCALTALCAHLRIPPAALSALARGEAVVVPTKATADMNSAAHMEWCYQNTKAPGWTGKREPWVLYRAMLAASPYAREAGDE